MAENILTEEFPELHRHYSVVLGVYDEYPSLLHTRAHFKQVMRAHGYKPHSNHVWAKPGFAIVIEPR